MTKVFAYILIVLFLSGCASYSDRKISTTTAKSSILDGQASYYCNNAIYVTNEGVYEGKKQLSAALDFWNSFKISAVKITKLSKEDFLIEYLESDKGMVGSRQYTNGADFHIDGEGVIEIKISSSCRGGDSPGLGCQWSSVKLFGDQSENLAVIQSDGGAGILGVFPVAVSGKYLSVFPRITRLGSSPASEIPAGMLSTECPDIKQPSQSNFETNKKKAIPTFAVGDVVVSYRRYDHGQKALISGAVRGYENTKWKVVEITREHVRLELIEGEFKPPWGNGKSYKPGSYTSNYSSSINYKTTFPGAGNLGQAFDEFRRDN